MTYIPDLGLTPVYKMQFKQLDVLGLNELVGLAYVQNLGLIMKWSPGLYYVGLSNSRVELNIQYLHISYNYAIKANIVVTEMCSYTPYTYTRHTCIIFCSLFLSLSLSLSSLSLSHYFKHFTTSQFVRTI